MLKLNQIHHVVIICKDYKQSKQFYTKVLGLKAENEVFRSTRNSWKLDLSLNGKILVELFSFPNPPDRVTRPEAAGLRHLAFEVDDVNKEVAKLKAAGMDVELVRTDEHTRNITHFSLIRMAYPLSCMKNKTPYQG